MNKTLLVACALAFSVATFAQTVGYTSVATGFTATGFVTQTPTGAGSTSGTTITRLFADDIQMTAGFGGTTVTNWKFSMVNLNTDGMTIAVRPRARFYAADGTGGGPGTYITGYSFNPIAINANTYTIVSTVANIAIPASGKFWAALCFDNNFTTPPTGSTIATTAQMNNIGQVLTDGPTVGSSADLIWSSTTTDGSGFLVNNPAGSTSNFNGAPVANFGWEFSGTPVPEPASMAVLGLGALAMLRRRRAKK